MIAQAGREPANHTGSIDGRPGTPTRQEALRSRQCRCAQRAKPRLNQVSAIFGILAGSFFKPVGAIRQPVLFGNETEIAGQFGTRVERINGAALLNILEKPILRPIKMGKASHVLNDANNRNSWQAVCSPINFLTDCLVRLRAGDAVLLSSVTRGVKAPVVKAVPKRHAVGFPNKDPKN